MLVPSQRFCLSTPLVRDGILFRYLDGNSLSCCGLEWLQTLLKSISRTRSPTCTDPSINGILLTDTNGALPCPTAFTLLSTEIVVAVLCIIILSLAVDYYFRRTSAQVALQYPTTKKLSSLKSVPPTDDREEPQDAQVIFVILCGVCTKLTLATCKRIISMTI